MAFNYADSAKIDLTVFGSLCTELPPPSLPHGVSPDCQDVIFVPGGVGSRPAAAKVFSPPFPAGGPSSLVPSAVWGKSYVEPNGDIDNLYLDSNGVIWLEDFSHAPGSVTQIGVTTPGSYAKSCTAFGREYIAISDGLHGQEMPLQFDGTNLDRVTQDGPGAAPAVASIALPSVNIATGPGLTLTVTEADPTTDLPPFSFYTSITFWTPSSVAGLQVGMSVTIAGNSSAAMNVTATIVQIATGGTTPGYQTAIFLNYYSPPGTAFGTGGTATVSTAAVQRSNNIVTVTTATGHQLQPGYRATIANLTAYAIGGGISSIVVNNEDLPGLATIKTVSAHGLAPKTFVSITGVTAATIDTAATATRAGGITTVVTATPNKLTAGAVVALSGFSNATFDLNVAILTVNSDTSFTFLQFGAADVTSAATGGTVVLNWPIPNTPTPTYFEVESCPAPTTFQVQLNYSDGTWGAGGAVTFAWNGTFFVLTVPSAMSFTYRQFGPDATAAAPVSPVATVTPFGQAAPGLHQMQVSYLTRQGAITRPSPPVTFEANGGQYISVSNIPIGPPNVVGRILQFTGSGGAYFFYIPATPEVNGDPVGTSTQINDNTTTGVLLDFGDNTLFASLAASTQGNQLANQIKLDGAIGFGLFGSRLMSWGQRNCVQTFLNLGFNGGYLPSQATFGYGGLPFPSGWQFTPGASAPPVALVTGRFNTTSLRIHITAGIPAVIFQGAYQDAYGAPILAPNTQYRFRAWMKPSIAAADAYVLLEISSISTGFTSIAEIHGYSMNTAGSWVEAVFTAKTPNVIPSDMMLTLNAAAIISGVDVDVADFAVIYDETPYLNNIVNASYVNNPEGFDGVTGQFGPGEDTHQVMSFGVLRNVMRLLTREPGGRIHDVYDNGVTEPAGWSVDEVAANCGLLSAFGLTESQADDAAASGGEEWMAWASTSGAYVYGGGIPEKISQEIQPDWSGGGNGQLTFPGINPAAYLAVWALNDYVNRVIYFGLPTGTATAPNLIYPMNYRELNSAIAIGNAAPFHPSYSGHLIATDNTRKWTRWNLPMNGAAMMYRTTGGNNLSVTLFGGNGQAPGVAAGYGNIYTLNSGLFEDDDYGLINPYYVTYFFVNRQDEALMRDDKGKPIGFGRKLLAYMSCFISGIGTLTITAYCDSMTNPWPLTGVRTLQANPTFDVEWTGGMAQAQRIALKFQASVAL